MSSRPLWLTGPLPIVHHPAYDARPLPGAHRFPMRKFARLADILRQDALAPNGFHQPLPAPASWLKLAHQSAYVDQVLNGNLPADIARDIGFPMGDPVMGEAIALRGRCATAGTVLTGMLALEHGLACNTAGGSHHARFEQGAGFCLFNDVAVAIRVLQADGLINRALVIDLDVHQGDGTALIFAGDDSVFTFSMHADGNYPHPKARSDLDMALPDGMEDDAYLDRLSDVLQPLLARVLPDLVFYNAGIDPHKDDRLGRLALSDTGLTARDRLVLDACLDRGWPVACVIGGGYSADAAALGQRHSILHRVASGFFAW